MEVHSEKLMDESDMQVLDEDDRFAAPPPHDQRKQQNYDLDDDSQFANKIVKERKTLDSPFRQQTTRL